MSFSCPKGVAGKNSSCHLLCWLTIDQTQSSGADLLFSQSGDPKFCTTFPLPVPLTIGLGHYTSLIILVSPCISSQLFYILFSFSHTNTFRFRQFSPAHSWCLLASLQQTSSMLASQVFLSPMQGSWSPAGGVLRSRESQYLPSYARCWSSGAEVTGKFLLCSSSSGSLHMEYPNNCLSRHLKRCKDLFFFPKVYKVVLFAPFLLTKTSQTVIKLASINIHNNIYFS